LQRPHVLIVSDDPGLSQFLGEGLIYAGLWTSVVASALQALEVFRLRSFDYVLVDAALGGIGALELVGRLRGRSHRATPAARTDIPIALIAAATDEIEATQAQQAGAGRLIVAPIEIDELALQVVQDVLAWRAAHPDRPWADAAALGEPKN
jgi:two-component system OmpR family response regulator